MRSLRLNNDYDDKNTTTTIVFHDYTHFTKVCKLKMSLSNYSFRKFFQIVLLHK